MSVDEMGIKEETAHHSVDPTGKQKEKNNVSGAMARFTDKLNA